MIVINKTKMTPQEKSKEIVSYYEGMLPSNIKGHFELAVKCATHAVNEIIETIYLNFYDSTNGTYEFWEEVKKELKNVS